jgi:hypothetical protein
LADLSDVTAYLAQAASGAVYPSGTSQPSVVSMDVRIFEGWPIPEQLDLDIGGKILSGNPPEPIARAGGPCCNVSIFPMPGATATPYQVLDNTFVLQAPVFGMSASISGNMVTITGEPNPNEFLTIVADGKYIYSEPGANTAAILEALATAIAANYPSVSYTATTITVPVVKTLTARIGGVGLLAKVTHRQRQGIMVTAWAPSPSVRSALAAAIDVAVKSQLIAEMPDTTQALVVYSGAQQSDDNQNVAIYRRDLMYQVEYATIEQFKGVVITSVSNTISPLDPTDLSELPEGVAIT